MAAALRLPTPASIPALASKLSEKDRPAFEAWLQASPDHPRRVGAAVCAGWNSPLRLPAGDRWLPLDAAGWLTPTPAEGWTIRDQVAHLYFAETRAVLTACGATAAQSAATTSASVQRTQRPRPSSYGQTS